MRSGIEIYGRAAARSPAPTKTRRPARPANTAAWSPRSRRPRTASANAVGVAVSALRLAPVLGPHVPSPLGRLLRQPVVPFSLLADSPFTVIQDSDAARAFVAAAEQRPQGPLNVVAPGAITDLQAIRRGRRLPMPLVGPEWRVDPPDSATCSARRSPNT